MDAAEHAEDVITARERLAGQIADALRLQGYYQAHLELHESQTLIDLQWAALLAGRALGQSTTTSASAVGAEVPGRITVVVAPRAPHQLSTRGGPRPGVVKPLGGHTGAVA